MKNLYSANDLTIISSDYIENDELVEYAIENQIDLIITLNLKPQSLSNNLKKMRPVNFTEHILTNSNINELTRKKVTFKFKVC